MYYNPNWFISSIFLLSTLVMGRLFKIIIIEIMKVDYLTKSVVSLGSGEDMPDTYKCRIHSLSAVTKLYEFTHVCFSQFLHL
jgi:hypothetical protein